MTHLCQNTHEQYETCTNREFPYDRGYKLCKTCDMHIKYEGRFCPCCGYLLRMKNRHIKFNKWTWETWSYMKAIKWCCDYYEGCRIIKVELKDMRLN